MLSDACSPGVEIDEPLAKGVPLLELGLEELKDFLGLVAACK